MVTTAAFLSKVFWVSDFWTFIFVPKKKREKHIINSKNYLKAKKPAFLASQFVFLVISS